VNETWVTIQGNVATKLRSGLSKTGTPYASFRVACSLRRQGPDGWRDVATSFYTVTAHRTLAEHVVASLQVGQPVLVYGRQLVKQWERDGAKGTDVEVEAVSVGHDLCRGTSMYARGGRRSLPARPEPAPDAVEAAAGTDPGLAVAGEHAA
jgi:single-strand DNA-binding protein